MKIQHKIHRFALCGGAMAYSAGILAEAIMGWKLDPRITLLSESAAKDRRDRRIYQGGDIVAGALFLAAGVAAQPPSATLLRWPLASLGAATIVDALSPLDYPITHRQLNAAAAEGRKQPSATHRTHFATTGVAGLATAAICLIDWRERTGGTSSVRRFAGPAVVLGQLAGLVSLASPRLVPGAVQRIQTLGFSALCIDLARRGLARSDSMHPQA